MDARVIEAAHTFGLPVTSHNFFLGSLARGLSGKEHASHYYRHWNDPYREDFLLALRAADVCVTPTLVTRAVHMLRGRSQFISMDENLLDDPALGVFWPPSVLQRAREAMRQPIPQARLTQLLAGERRELEDVRRLWKAGVRIATGTDIASPWNEFGLHLEMELFVKAGMPPLEAIRSATFEGARYLGVERDLGSVEVGKGADFIIVDGNPALEIRDTRRIVWVVVGGRAYTRQQIVDTVRQGVR